MSKQLQAAIDLIADPARWTTGVTSRDVDGNFVYVNDATAVCWDAVGAMAKESVRFPIRERVDMYCRMVLGRSGAPETNDGPDGHARVLEAMRAVQGGWKLGDTPTTVMKITRKQT